MAALTLSRSAAALAHVGAGAIGGGAGRWRTQGQPGRAVGDGAGHWHTQTLGQRQSAAQRRRWPAATRPRSHWPAATRPRAHAGAGAGARGWRLGLGGDRMDIG